ncbi:TPA: hypothetical protein ACU23K_002744 [Staphylococcus aureus]|nr:hypothetical protein [Staphylococcus aureus]EHS25218.1 hypothetical protein IS88_2361 [Staphylococcus aureus subsp. aureus IS-88]HAY1011902.1 hypothetical protein [Staphylococcus aureus]HCV8805760.1 hypothetical protein [Staphylococcus aureus]
MNNQHYYFEANSKDYRLSVSTDLFGCSGIEIFENGVYIGMIDCKDEQDFNEVENAIKYDLESIINSEVYS